MFEILDLSGYGWTDTNGDGYGDVGGADLDGNGLAETFAVDTGADGYADLYAWDTDGNGAADTFSLDTDGDGYLDTSAWDTDADGTADLALGTATGGAYVALDDPAPVAVVGPATSGPVTLAPSVTVTDPAGFATWNRIQQDIADTTRIWTIPDGYELVREDR